MNFQITGLNALLLVALCVPGFLLTKFKLLKEEHIKGFAVFLMYVCSPALSLYSFQQAQCNADMLKNIGILILIAAVMQFVLLGLAYQRFQNKSGGKGRNGSNRIRQRGFFRRAYVARSFARPSRSGDLQCRIKRSYESCGLDSRNVYAQRR